MRLSSVPGLYKPFQPSLTPLSSGAGLVSPQPNQRAAMSSKRAFCAGVASLWWGMATRAVAVPGGPVGVPGGGDPVLGRLLHDLSTGSEVVRAGAPRLRAENAGLEELVEEVHLDVVERHRFVEVRGPGEVGLVERVRVPDRLRLLEAGFVLQVVDGVGVHGPRLGRDGAQGRPGAVRVGRLILEHATRHHHLVVRQVGVPPRRTGLLAVAALLLRPGAHAVRRAEERRVADRGLALLAPLLLALHRGAEVRRVRAGGAVPETHPVLLALLLLAAVAGGAALGRRAAQEGGRRQRGQPDRQRGRGYAAPHADRRPRAMPPPPPA